MRFKDWTEFEKALIFLLIAGLMIQVYFVFFRPTTVIVTIEGKLDLMPLIKAAAKTVLGEEATGLFSGIKAPDQPEIYFDTKDKKGAKKK